MRQLVLCLIVGVLASGCATQAPNPWTDLTTDTSPAATPLDCGSFPLPDEIIGDAGLYDNGGLNDLEAFRACSERNAAIVTEHALQIGYLKVSRAHLVQAGQSQRNIADMRQTMLEDERKARLWNNLTLYAVIAAMGLAL